MLHPDRPSDTALRQTLVRMGLALGVAGPTRLAESLLAERSAPGPHAAPVLSEKAEIQPQDAARLSLSNPWDHLELELS
jgi:hypothetical protein